jgi:hypothetical protein
MLKNHNPFVPMNNKPTINLENSSQILAKNSPMIDRLRGKMVTAIMVGLFSAQSPATTSPNKTPSNRNGVESPRPINIPLVDS